MILLTALVTLQTLPSAVPEPGSALSATARPCAAGPNPDGDVVVCARSRDADRLKPPAALVPARKFDPLGFRLPGGGSGRVQAFQREYPGAIGQGVAVTATIPLGRKRRADGEVR